MKKSILAMATVMALAQATALAQSQFPVRVGGNVTAPERIKYVAPVYPDDARAASVSGIIILEALIGSNGDVTDARVLKSIPLLDQAALDAVKQWRYTATTLNGQPVPVIMTVTVNFALDGPATSQPTQATPMSSPMSSLQGGSLAQDWKGVPPLRIGGQITPPERLKYVAPVYPAIAQQSKVSGIIILEAIIDENGDVAMTKILKGIPLLDQAALDAVGQWKYTPTTMNGVPVPVLMTVTVSFTLTLQ